MKAYEFLLTEEGWQLNVNMRKAFRGGLGIDEADGVSILYEVDGDAYLIPEEEDASTFRRTVEESLRTGKDLLRERYDRLPDDWYIDGNDY